MTTLILRTFHISIDNKHSKISMALLKPTHLIVQMIMYNVLTHLKKLRNLHLKQMNYTNCYMTTVLSVAHPKPTPSIPTPTPPHSLHVG